MDSPRWCAYCKSYGGHHTDRHAEATGTLPTLLVPIDADSSDRLIDNLGYAEEVVDDSEAKVYLRNLAFAIRDARIAAGLDT